MELSEIIGGIAILGGVAVSVFGLRSSDRKDAMTASTGAATLSMAGQAEVREGQNDLIANLQADNATLRTEIRELRMEVRELKEKVDELLRAK